MARDRHQQFDFLSGVHATDRSEADIIRPEVFDALDARLDRLSAVATHATKHFAHAATALSRQGRVLDNWGVEEAKNALCLLTETAELVGRWFLYSGVGDVLPTPHYDQFAYLDQPLIARETLPALQEQWQTFARETAVWPHIEDRAL